MWFCNFCVKKFESPAHFYLLPVIKRHFEPKTHKHSELWSIVLFVASCSNCLEKTHNKLEFGRYNAAFKIKKIFLDYDLVYPYSADYFSPTCTCAPRNQCLPRPGIETSPCGQEWTPFGAWRRRFRTPFSTLGWHRIGWKFKMAHTAVEGSANIHVVWNSDPGRK